MHVIQNGSLLVMDHVQAVKQGHLAWAENDDNIRYSGNLCIMEKDRIV